MSGPAEHGAPMRPPRGPSGGPWRQPQGRRRAARGDNRRAAVRRPVETTRRGRLQAARRSPRAADSAVQPGNLPHEPALSRGKPWLPRRRVGSRRGTIAESRVVNMAKKTVDPRSASPRRAPSRQKAPKRASNPGPEAVETAADRPVASAESAAGAPSTEEIAEAAYHRFLRRGGSGGHDFEDWIEAERELRERRPDHRPS